MPNSERGKESERHTDYGCMGDRSYIYAIGKKNSAVRENMRTAKYNHIHPSPLIGRVLFKPT